MSEPRFRQLTLEELDDEQRRVIEPIVAFFGSFEGPFNPTLRSAELSEKTFALGQHLLFGSTLPRPLIEMVVLIRARFSFSQLEWWSHRRLAREAGLSDAICNALHQGRRPEVMTEHEAVAYDFSIELLQAPAVSDETFARARDAFGERGVVELTHVLGFYSMIALVLKMAEIGAPDGSTPLQPMADPFPLGTK